MSSAAPKSRPRSRSGSNAELATLTVFSEGKTPEQIRDEILRHARR
jgi:hypothetical protein